MKIVVADSSQIEARMLNTLAEQWDVLAEFEKGDPYSAMAALVYERPINKKDNPKERQDGKGVELGCGFGMGAPKLRETMRKADRIITLVFAQYAVRKYRERHPKVVDYWGVAETALQLLHARVKAQPWWPMLIDDGRIVLPNGTALDYTGLVREEGEWRMRNRAGDLMRNQWGYPIRLYGGMLTENVVQALSRVLLAEWIVTLRKEGALARWPLVMTTHDELAALAPDDEAQACLDTMMEHMTRRPVWLPQIPLAAEGGFDECYSK